jgi:uncharacterized membrane protein YkvA (DUF1232 family)
VNGGTGLAAHQRRARGARRGELLAFYDRLRRGAVEAAAGRLPRAGKPVAEALLLVPDIFVLLVRLMLDPEVPASSRALIGGAIAYFVLPVDLLPEALVGFGGYLDDLVIAAAVLSQALGGELEPLVTRHWSGERKLRLVLHDLAASASALLGRDLYERIERALAKRGIEVRG